MCILHKINSAKSREKKLKESKSCFTVKMLNDTHTHTEKVFINEFLYIICFVTFICMNRLTIHRNQVFKMTNSPNFKQKNEVYSFPYSIQQKRIWLVPQEITVPFYLQTSIW